MPVLVTPQALRLGWEYLIEIEGPNGALAHAYVEKVDMPATKLATVTYGAGGIPHNMKIASGIEDYDDLVLTTILLHEGDDASNWARQWLLTAVDEQAMRVGVPSEYKRTISIGLLNHRQEVSERHRWEGAFVREAKVDQVEATNKGQKMLCKITIAVDRRIQA